MQYDWSAEALFHPERSGTLFGNASAWSPGAICAELSRLAYIRFEQGDLPKLVAALARGGFGPPQPFADGARDAQGFGTVGPDGTFYLAYRGTQPDKIKDIASDAHFWLTEWAGPGRVHSGFLDAEQSLAQQVDAWLGGRGAARLVITGHSLGAAMATITAARLGAGDLVTIGSPRVGDSVFRDSFAGRTVRRYVDCCDLVTKVPLAISYCHLAGEEYIERGGNVLAAPLEGLAREDDQLSADAEYLVRCAWRPGAVPIRDLADHAPINYVSAILGVRQGP